MSKVKKLYEEWIYKVKNTSDACAPLMEFARPAHGVCAIHTLEVQANGSFSFVCEKNKLNIYNMPSQLKLDVRHSSYFARRMLEKNKSLLDF